MPLKLRTDGRLAAKKGMKSSAGTKKPASLPPSTVPRPADVNPEFVPLPIPGRDETATEVLDRSLVFNLVTLTNRIASENSRILLATYDIGVAAFQTLRFVRLEPQCTPARICAVTTMDKSVVSRSLQVLSEKGLVTSTVDPTDSRRQFWTLTPAGVRLVDDAMTGAIGRQKMLLSGLSDQEIKSLYTLLKRVKGNVYKLGEIAASGSKQHRAAKRPAKKPAR